MPPGPVPEASRSANPKMCNERHSVCLSEKPSTVMHRVVYEERLDMPLLARSVVLRGYLDGADDAGVQGGEIVGGIQYSRMVFPPAW